VGASTTQSINHINHIVIKQSMLCVFQGWYVSITLQDITLMVGIGLELQGDSCSVVMVVLERPVRWGSECTVLKNIKVADAIRMMIRQVECDKDASAPQSLGYGSRAFSARSWYDTGQPMCRNHERNERTTSRPNATL
jgi:hypothetical protein